MMDSLIRSRMRKDVSPARLTNLSPDKYGKAAWADMTYTPSKLADNVIFREAATLKKNEEGSNKLRQFEAMNGFMKERLNQLQQERDGIQLSLNQQIGMYKKMYYDAEAKHEQRLKEIQKRFSSQITMLISQKQEEAKFAQAEKEMLQEKIAELEGRLKDSEDREANLNNQYGGLMGNKQKLDLELLHLKDFISRLERDRAGQQDQWKRQRQQLSRRAQTMESNYQDQLQKLNHEKEKQKQSLQRLMKTEIQKLENIRVSEGLRKSQEMRDVIMTFQNQTKRLNQIIEMKDRMLESLTYQNAKNKQNLLEITASYESRVNSLTHNRNDLAGQLEQSLMKIAELENQLDEEVQIRTQDRQSYGRTIVDLKEQLQMNQMAFVRDRDRYEYWGADMEKQNIMLRSENQRTAEIFQENTRLSTQLRKLRDLLMQSSYQIERSKEELIRISYQRDSLSTKLQQVMAQNDRMYRVKRDIQEQTAAKWRSSYRAEQRMYR